MIEAGQRIEREIITAIDDHGNCYPISKLDAHIRNVPHLAISIFLFNEGRLLMQQRAASKYHSGGLWANTCCSHPRWQETLPDCAHRRLVEEVGCRTPLTHFGTINYSVAVGELFENEVAHCYVGYMKDAVLPIVSNTEEVQALRWQTLDQLQRGISSCPDEYSPWVRIYMQEHFELIANVVHPTTANGIASGTAGGVVNGFA